MTFQYRIGEHADIICAPATPEGTSALAVIRVSGSGCVHILEKLMELQEGRLAGTRRKTGFLRHGDRIVDQVVALSWPEGSSYTGEEMVEIICHGVSERVRGVMDCLMDNEMRKAEPGEFTRRAFVNGRLSAWQVITLASIWSSEGESGSSGDESENHCRKMLEKVEHARVSLEGDIEFMEEHPSDGCTGMEVLVEDLLGEVVEFGKLAEVLEATCRVVLMGPVNSGKSTLYNRLSKGQSALVSCEPGTTRDGASSRIEIRGRRLLLCDSAGAGGSGMDRRAYEAAIRSIDGTDKVIWMTERAGVAPPEEVVANAGEVIEIRSKSDLIEDGNGERESGILRVSSVSGEGLEELRERMVRLPGSMSITGAASRITSEVSRSLDFIKDGDYSIAAEHLARAEEEIRNIVGSGGNVLLSVERALGSMCVGK
jgi:tRNA modification GTPase